MAKFRITGGPPLRVLVTGGAGYLGSVLTAALLANGCKVTVVDNFLFGQSPLNDCCSLPGFDVVRGDARDMGLIQPLLRDHDVVIPLAALVGAPLCDARPAAAHTTNYLAVYETVYRLSKEQWLIAPISNSGYGVGQLGIECTEDTPMKPITLYGQTKVDAEKAVLDHPNGISLRLATVFGMSPRMRIDLLVNNMVYRAVTDGCVVLYEPHFVRNYIHVRDVTNAFLHVIDHFETMPRQPYNVGLSDANLSKRDLCKKIREHIPGFEAVSVEYRRDPDQRNYMVSNARFEATGFKPRFSLDDGIRELIKGYKMLRNTRYGNV